eukprot:g5498.t1
MLAKFFPGLAKKQGAVDNEDEGIPRAEEKKEEAVSVRGKVRGMREKKATPSHQKRDGNSSRIVVANEIKASSALAGNEKDKKRDKIRFSKIRLNSIGTAKRCTPPPRGWGKIVLLNPEEEKRKGRGDEGNQKKKKGKSVQIDENSGKQSKKKLSDATSEAKARVHAAEKDTRDALLAATSAYKKHISTPQKLKSSRQRSKLNLSSKSKALSTPATGGIEFMRYAKGPDGTVGFRKPRKAAITTPKGKKKKRSSINEGKNDKNISSTSCLTTEAMRSVGVLLSLRFLSFRSQHFIGSMLSRFCSEKFSFYVQRIDLRGKLIDDNCLHSIQRLVPQCSALEELDLSGQNLKKHVLPILTGIPSCRRLRRLNLYANHMGPQGIMYLGHALQYCPEIVELGLAWNNIDDNGIRSLANMMVMSPRLARVDLRFNPISRECVEMLSSYIRQAKPGFEFRYMIAETA